MYTTISDFGQINNTLNDPATYCILDGLDSQFMHGSTGMIFGKGNFECSEYMSNRCASEWDELCQAYSETDTNKFPRAQGCPKGLNDGESFLRETAFKKYLLASKNCYSVCEPFDPTVADSPMVCYEIGTAPTTGVNPGELWMVDRRPLTTCLNGGCVLDKPPCEKIYGFTDKQMSSLDADPVMINLLRNPNVAFDLLILLSQWVKRTGNYQKIYNTHFWRFARSNGWL